MKNFTLNEKFLIWVLPLTLLSVGYVFAHFGILDVCSNLIIATVISIAIGKVIQNGMHIKSLVKLHTLGVLYYYFEAEYAYVHSLGQVNISSYGKIIDFHTEVIVVELTPNFPLQLQYNTDIKVIDLKGEQLQAEDDYYQLDQEQTVYAILQNKAQHRLYLKCVPTLNDKSSVHITTFATDKWS